MEAKKIILVSFLLIMLAMPSFASITDYAVPTEMPLNLEITATGKSLNDSNVPNVNELCSFYFIESDSGYLVDRATDQYTDKTGRFAMQKFKLTEPDFIRGQSYILKSVCGSNEDNITFLITQKQEAFDLFGVALYPQALVMDILYWNNPVNSTIVFLGILLIMFAGTWLISIWYHSLH